MPNIDFYIVDAFTQTPFAGNPAGVVFQDGSLTDWQMQQIAGELHLESAFVAAERSGEADYRVAYYTGAARVPLCGHDTIAAVAALRHRGQIGSPGSVRLTTDVGMLSVRIDEIGEITMEQALPAYGQEIDAKDVAQSLGLDRDRAPLPAQIVSTGTPFLLLPVSSPETVDGLTPDMGRLAAVLPDEAAGVYVWAWAEPDLDVLVHARCFAPNIGLPEDPVTGSASGALGAYLARRRPDLIDANGLLAFQTEQGQAMGRPGHARVRVQVKNDNVMRVEVAGQAVIVGQGTLKV